MVKSKKMSKSSVAIIVLALLLVLSMVLGLTGAWFTQQDKSSNVPAILQFGHITADDLVGAGSAVATTSDIKAVPGDYVTLDTVGVQYAANVDTYLFIHTMFKVEVQFPEGEYTEVGQAVIDELFGAGTYANLQSLVALSQDAQAQNYKAPAEQGTFAANHAYEAARGYNWYLYQVTPNAATPGANTQQVANDAAIVEDYEVEFASGQNANLVLTINGATVSNQGENVNPAAEGAHNWTDAHVKVTYEVIARVIQANHTTDEAGVEGVDAAAKALNAFKHLPALA